MQEPQHIRAMPGQRGAAVMSGAFMHVPESPITLGAGELHGYRVYTI